jgi:KUP system potassium uptake protein
MNWFLAASCLLLVLIFQRSSRLAAAYGLAVSGTMAITSVVFFIVARHTWRWSLPKAASVLVLFLSFDVPFVVANLLKFFHGGYVPVLAGAGFFTAMLVWRRGRAILTEYYAQRTRSLDAFLADLSSRVLTRIPGVGVFLASAMAGVPPVLVHLVERLQTLHKTVVLLTIVTTQTPTVPADDRINVEDLGQGIYRIVARYGYLETPNVVSVLQHAEKFQGVPVRLQEATFFLGRETFLAGPRGQMSPMVERLFRLLARNARNASLYFGVPPEQVIEVGIQLDL